MDHVSILGQNCNQLHVPAMDGFVCSVIRVIHAYPCAWVKSLKCRVSDPMLVLLVGLYRIDMCLNTHLSCSWHVGLKFNELMNET